LSLEGSYAVGGAEEEVDSVKARVYRYVSIRDDNRWRFLR